VPLTHLIKTNLTFAWDEKNANSVETLKKPLTSAPVLTVLDGMKSFTIYTDTCGMRLCAVLMQEGRVVTYASRLPKDHEKRSSTHDLELASIVFVLKIYRHYHLEERFELFIDHKSLKYLFSQRDLNLRRQRWTEFLASYDFEIQYNPQKRECHRRRPLS